VPLAAARPALASSVSDHRADPFHGPPGIYHSTSSGQTTWFGLAREIRAAHWPGRPNGRTTACSKRCLGLVAW